MRSLGSALAGRAVIRRGHAPKAAGSLTGRMRPSRAQAAAALAVEADARARGPEHGPGSDLRREVSRESADGRM